MHLASVRRLRRSVSSGFLSAQALAALLAAPVFRYVPPLVSSAQMIRAILLASATATTLKGLRAKSPISHRGALSLPFARRRTNVAPHMWNGPPGKHFLQTFHPTGTVRSYVRPFSAVIDRWP